MFIVILCHKGTPSVLSHFKRLQLWVNNNDMKKKDDCRGLCILVIGEPQGG